MDTLLVFLAGLTCGVFAGKQSNAEMIHQRKIYEARLAQQEENVQYYKKLTRELVAENQTLKEKINDTNPIS